MTKDDKRIPPKNDNGNSDIYQKSIAIANQEKLKEIAERLNRIEEALQKMAEKNN